MISGMYLRQLALVLLLVALLATAHILVKNGLGAVAAMSPQLILLTIATALVAQCCSDTRLF